MYQWQYASRNVTVVTLIEQVRFRNCNITYALPRSGIRLSSGMIGKLERCEV